MLVGDELEFAISQYLDGQLSADGVAALEERLATDSNVREMLSAYQQLNDKLCSARSIPEVDFNALAERISDGFSSAKDRSAAGSLSVGHGWFIGRPSVAAGFWPQFARPLALAASLLVAVAGVSLLVMHSHKLPVSAPIVAVVSGPTVEQSSGPVVAQVTIGAAPSVASTSYRSTDDIVDRPSIVLIDRADNPPPDLY